MKPIAREAEKLAGQFGWTVFPCNGKKPACKWKPLQTGPANQWHTRKLFDRGGTGLAVITGPPSRGLAIRDFDDQTAYARWAAQFPHEAATFPTAITRRGRHVYFRSPSPAFVDLGDGELRADQFHYTLTPPSLHPDGGTYRWETPPVAGSGGNLKLIDPAAAGLDRAWGDTEQTISQSLPDKRNGTHRHSNDCVFHSLEHDFTGAISKAIPAKPGQRNACLFILARILKSDPALIGSEPAALEPVVRQWHKASLPAIKTKGFSESWSDFLRAWESIRVPIGGTAVDVALGNALVNDPPAAALHYPDPSMRLLIGILADLQRHVGEGSFFLSVRNAARALGIDGNNAHRDSWRMLRQLENDGVIVCVHRGKQGPAGSPATEYRYHKEF